MVRRVGAILAVADIERSVGFYRDRIGFHAYWGSEEETLENYERLLSNKQATLRKKGSRR